MRSSYLYVYICSGILTGVNTKINNLEQLIHHRLHFLKIIFRSNFEKSDKTIQISCDGGNWKVNRCLLISKKTDFLFGITVITQVIYCKMIQKIKLFSRKNLNLNYNKIKKFISTVQQYPNWHRNAKKSELKNFKKITKSTLGKKKLL